MVDFKKYNKELYYQYKLIRENVSDYSELTCNECSSKLKLSFKETYVNVIGCSNKHCKTNNGEIENRRVRLAFMDKASFLFLKIFKGNLYYKTNLVRTEIKDYTNIQCNLCGNDLNLKFAQI